MEPVACHTSHVTHHTSHITRKAQRDTHLGQQSASVQVQHVDARRHTDGDDVRVTRVALFKLHCRALLVGLRVQVGVFDLGSGKNEDEKV